MSFWKKKPDSDKPGLPSEEAGPQPSVLTPAHGAAPSAPPLAAASSQDSSRVSSASATSAPAMLPSGNVKPEEVLSERFGKARSALGEGTVIQGKLSFDTPVRIDGKLSGEIFSSKVLIVGPAGRIDATVEAASLVVLGAVTGNITASERVELWAGASLEGVVTTPVLIIQEGSVFSGTCRMLTAQVGYAAETLPPVDRGSDKAKAATSSQGAAQATAPADSPLKQDLGKGDRSKDNKSTQLNSTQASSAKAGSAKAESADPKKDAHVH